MTNLMYRGFAHEKSNSVPSHAPQAMIYRGQPHDGSTPRALRSAAALCYRGVAFERASDGQIMPITPAPLAGDMVASG